MTRKYDFLIIGGGVAGEDVRGVRGDERIFVVGDCPAPRDR